MEKTFITDELRGFILLAIPSVPYLEAMLLMRRDPDLTWDATQIAQRLYLCDKVVKGLLSDLIEGGVIRHEKQASDRFRFAPQSEQLAAMIDHLAVTYAQNLIGVSTLIHSRNSANATGLQARVST